ncbi:GGDEF domain-containing protein [Bradyrhizobium sp. WBOS7]|uniref:diguanylate cyclase n=1 Tax=Bradyrhizobium betae TaxID=244734 RepID=A0AAE9N4R0_9BRAD|nr:MULTISPECIES: diguanylate cyclase [Bradyrhizobium]MDD1573134.1 GGDEF domain-containing protein [Bradyrhizobium sp. WBOS1]UUO33938.1 GGDEF domain-containing protein [Bradyrhizobium sp. WBOS01]MDD1528497.1 GGDEF domain-containing protein [Bradyrhizobium sp. WBOS2]MDD1577181.1 GGDEF domain-containing protein [Bradyrhizobium sp. WBOS7]MDD1600228.1 GGDEF domain-containing protein [Bradyrhizobium sp. WBOS16]
MTSISLNRKRAKLKQVLGIRARLALLAVILVAPLMFERIRSLEDTRARQIAQATVEFTTIARHSADAQREVISSVETILKAEAFIRASAGGISKSCDVLRASLPSNLPWIRTLMIAGQDGRIQCATNNTYVGLDLSDRPYFQQAQESGRFVLSDFILSRPVQTPTVMAVYPVSVFSGVADAVVLATVNLDWMSKVMNNLGSRAGITAVLVDSAGTVLAAPADQHGVIGRPLDRMPLMAAIADRALRSDQDEGSLSFLAADGSRRAVSYIRIAGTNARLIASIDEDKVSAAVSRDIRTAYLQLAFVVVFVLLGALIAAEKLVIKPIEMLVDMAKRLGEGDLSARAARNRLPAEFVPLARAFNAMAAQLSQRERELIASNDRLTVMASIDMLSGLANRRGFQSRLDFEWMRAQQYGSDLALLMIDVDHFKLFNDTYGHLEGDSCLTRLGESLSGIAADTMGFAARYGGEEFCLLLPNTDVTRAVAIGEQVRATVLKLCLPHITSAHMIVTVSIGVAATKPNESLRPGDLIEAADAALYAAKHRGRNNVVEHGIQAIESGTPDMMMAASA